MSTLPLGFLGDSSCGRGRSLGHSLDLSAVLKVRLIVFVKSFLSDNSLTVEQPLSKSVVLPFNTFCFLLPRG